MNGDTTSINDSARQALAWLAHPVTLAALVVLLVNDHLLKAVWPGFVTGKLSDVAGLVLAPPLLAGLLLMVARSVPADPVAIAAVAVVGTLFAAVKALPDAAAAASSAWSVLNGPSLVRSDPGDLWTLPALVVTWLTWRRCRDRRAPENWTRAVRAAVVLPLALLGVVATSAADTHLEIATGVGPGVGDDAVILVGRDGVTATSADGIAWRPAPEYDAAALATARHARPVVCTPVRCFRVVPGALRVEQSSDGGATWLTAWSIDDARRERYATILAGEARSDRDYTGDVRADLECGGLYVVPRSEVVVAACGLVGFVRRDPTGDWVMIGFAGDATDVPRSDVYTSVENANSLMIVLFGWFILLAGAEAHAAVRRGASGARLAVAVLVSLGCLPVMALPWIFPESEDPFWTGLTVMPVLLLGMGLWLVLYARRRGSFPFWLLPLAVAAPVTGLVLQGQRIGGHPGSANGWSAIAAFAVAALVANVLLGIWLPRRRARPVPARG